MKRFAISLISGLFLTGSLFAQPSRIILQVIDNFTKLPVVSDLAIITGNNAETLLGKTDERGFYTIECPGSSITIKVAPVDKLRYYGRKIVCTTLSPAVSPNLINLLSRYSAAAFNLVIDSLTQKSRYADVAYLYNLQAENYRLTDSSSAVAANERQSWVYMGKFLHVDHAFVFDSTGGWDYKISPELSTAILKFQRNKNLTPNNETILDLNTTRKASKTHLNDILVKIPGAVARPD